MKRDPFHRNRKIRDAMYRATIEAMRERPEIYLMGEGSHMKVHFDCPELEKEFSERVITLPITEDANTNFAVGLTLAGLVPIVDVISSDFLYRTFDAIANTAAKQATVAEPRTIVIKAEFLTGGPTTGQRIESLFAAIPGLRVGVPSNPDDAYAMMADALKHPGVTVLFEDRMISDSELDQFLYKPLQKWATQSATPPKGAVSRIPDGIIVSYGLTQHILRWHGWASLDLMWLYPLDLAVMLNNLKKRVLYCNAKEQSLLIVEPAQTFLGIGAEIAAQVAEALPGVRIKRIGAPRCVIPASRELHDQMLPTIEQVKAALKELEAAGGREGTTGRVCQTRIRQGNGALEANSRGKKPARAEK
jgi:pyruvate/2-oxoglutarate/acetoin dehydrogenase E1 component